MKELTGAAGALFKGAILNKVASPEQGEMVAEKLTRHGVSVLGSIGLSGEIQSACLEGKPLDSQVASGEIGKIISLLV